MKRTIHSIRISFLVLALTACVIDLPFLQGTNTATTSASTIPATVPVETAGSLLEAAPESLRGTTIHIWHAFTGPAATLFSTQLNEFNTGNEWGIILQQAAMLDYRTLFEEINTALEGNVLPDIVVVPPEFALSWQQNVTDLTPYVEDPLYGLTDEEIADIPAIFWQQDEVEGFRLGVPAQRTARLLVQNATWAGELGMDSPPPDSESFREQACAGNQAKKEDDVVSNDGYGGWVVDSDLYTSLSWLVAFKGGVFEYGQFNFNRPSNKDALSFLKKLFDDSCAYLSTEPLSYTPLVNRSALFTTVGLGDLTNVTRAFEISGSGDTWKVLPFPGKETAIIVYGPSYTIMQSTRERQLAAWLFVRWLLSPERQARWVEKTGLFPLRNSSLDLLADYRTGHPQWDEAVDLLSVAQGYPQTASWYEIKFILGDGVYSLFRMDIPGENISDVLTDMDATTEELLH